MKFLVFIVVAAGAVAAGVFLSKFAPKTDDDTTYVAPRTVRRPARAPTPGIVDSQLDSLKETLGSLKHRQREMQDLLPPEERDPASVTKNEAADALFKKDKSLDDYKTLIMETVKSLSHFGKDITEEK